MDASWSVFGVVFVLSRQRGLLRLLGLALWWNLSLAWVGGDGVKGFES